MGIVSGMIRGERAARRDQRDDANQKWLKEQREFKAKRERVQAKQNDTTFDNNQTKFGWDVDDRQHELERRPTVEKQKDQQAADLHDERRGRVHQIESSIKGQKQLRRIRGAQEGRAKQNQQWRANDRALTQPIKEIDAGLKLDDAKTRQRIRTAQKGYLKAAKDYESSGDPRVFARWYNDKVAPHGNHISMHQDANGAWWVDDSMGHSNKIGSPDDVLRYASTLTDPSVFVQHKQAERQAALQHQEDIRKHPNAVQRVVGPDGNLYDHYVDSGKSVAITDADGHPITAADNHGAGGSGKIPARLQEVQAVLRNLPHREGETRQQRYMRAYHIALQNGGQSLAQQKQSLWRQVYSAQMRSGYSNADDAKEKANKAVSTFGAMFDDAPRGGGSRSGTSATGLTGSMKRGAEGAKDDARTKALSDYTDGQAVRYSGKPYWYTSKGLIPREDGQSFEQAAAALRTQ